MITIHNDYELCVQSAGKHNRIQLTSVVNTYYPGSVYSNQCTFFIPQKTLQESSLKHINNINSGTTENPSIRDSAGSNSCLLCSRISCLFSSSLLQWPHATYIFYPNIDTASFIASCITCILGMTGRACKMRQSPARPKVYSPSTRRF